jgi:hypothetical protein
MSYKPPYALNVFFEHSEAYRAPQPDRVIFGLPLTDFVSVDFSINLDANAVITLADPVFASFTMSATGIARMTLIDNSIHLSSAPVENINLTLNNIYDSISINVDATQTIEYSVNDVVHGQHTGEILCYMTGIVTKQIMTVDPPVILSPPSCTLDFFFFWDSIINQRKQNIIKYSESFDLIKRLKSVYNKYFLNSKELIVRLGIIIEKGKLAQFRWHFFDSLFNIDLSSIISKSIYINNNSKIVYEKHPKYESIEHLVKYTTSINLEKGFVVPFVTKTIVDVGECVVQWGYCTSPLYKDFVVFYQPRCYSGNDFFFPFNPPDPPDPNITLILPIKDCYLMTCSTSIKLYPEMNEIEANSVTLTTDMDSFAWKVSFDLYYPSDADALMPAAGYKEVIITVCGHTFLCVIESVSRQESFSGSSYRASGRSISAYLTSPYVSTRDYIQSSDLSVVQIAEEELFGFTGWTINWRSIADFLVPAGTFKYSNKTPLQAIKYIAEGVGAFIQTDKFNKVISIIPNYPYSPWTWHLQNPDASIPINVITNESITKATKPLYERVYCIGETNGILMEVTRQGTAGVVLHEQFLHPLICDTAAGIEAGRVILSKRGDSWLHSLQMPLFDIAQQPILMLPGHLIEVQRIDLSTWIGQCRSTSIKSTYLGDTTQTIEIEKRNV